MIRGLVGGPAHLPGLCDPCDQGLPCTEHDGAYRAQVDALADELIALRNVAEAARSVVARTDMGMRPIIGPLRAALDALPKESS